MTICFTKYGDIISEFKRLDSDWSENSIELIWDIKQISKEHKVVLVSQFGHKKMVLESNNTKLIILPNLKPRLLKLFFNNLLYQIYVLIILKKNKVNYFIPSESRSFGRIIAVIQNRLKIEVIPNLSRIDHIQKYYLKRFKKNKIKKIIVPGEYYKNILKQNLIGNDISVKVRMPTYPNSFNQQTKNKKINTPSPNFLFAARLIKSKGIYEFLNAAKKCKQEKIQANFYIVGSGIELPNVKKFITDNNLEKSIKLIGDVTNLEIGNFMVNSDVLIFPSYSEGFAKTWIESIITHTPVIMTKLPAIEMLFEHKKNTYFVDVKDSNQIFEGICFFIKNPEQITLFKTNIENLSQTLKKRQNGNFKECVEQLIN